MLPAARIRMNLRRLVEVDGDIEMRSSDAQGRGSSMTPPPHHCAQENLSLLLLRACGKSSSVVRHCSSSSLSAMAAGASGEALRGVCNLPTIILAAVHTGSDTHWQRYTQQQNGLAVSRWRRRQRPREEGVGGLSEEICLRDTSSTVDTPESLRVCLILVQNILLGHPNSRTPNICSVRSLLSLVGRRVMSKTPRLTRPTEKSFDGGRKKMK